MLINSNNWLKKLRQYVEQRQLVKSTYVAVYLALRLVCEPSNIDIQLAEEVYDSAGFSMYNYFYCAPSLPGHSRHGQATDISIVWPLFLK